MTPILYDSDTPDRLYLSGTIDIRTPVLMSQALARYPRVRTLVLSSPGGSVHAALAIAYTVRAEGLKTHIDAGAKCFSACAFPFFAGIERTAEGALGVHQLSSTSGDLAAGQVALADIVTAFSDFEVPSELLNWMLTTPVDEMYILQPDAMKKLGLFDASASRTSAKPQTELQVESLSQNVTTLRQQVRHLQAQLDDARERGADTAARLALEARKRREAEEARGELEKSLAAALAEGDEDSAPSFIQCDQVDGTETATVELEAKEFQGHLLNCISGNFVVDMSGCAPDGGYGLHAGTGSAPLVKIVSRWQDYADWIGPVSSGYVNSTEIYFSGGFQSDSYEEAWEFRIDRLTGAGRLTEADQRQTTSVKKREKFFRPVIYRRTLRADYFNRRTRRRCGALYLRSSFRVAPLRHLRQPRHGPGMSRLSRNFYHFNRQRSCA